MKTKKSVALVGIVMGSKSDLPIMKHAKQLLQEFKVPFEINIVSADNGRSGLNALSQQSPDLVISDIMMPHMDGIEFVQEVRRHTEWVEIPFIFLTALGGEEDVLKGRLSGADLY